MSRTVVFYTDTTGYGGAERCLLNLLRCLDGRSWRSVLIHHRDPRVEPLVQEARSLDVITVPVPFLPTNALSKVQITTLCGTLKELRADVFNAHLTWPLACRNGIVAAALQRVPAIVSTLHLFVEQPYGKRVRLRQLLLSRMLHGYIAVSEAVALGLMRSFGIPRSKIRVVPNGIPMAPFADAKPRARASLNRGTQRPVVLNIARLECRQKGQDHLLRAAVLVPEAEFVFVGDGPDRDRLEGQARELQVDNRVVFLGHRNDIPGLLAACDVFVLPSLWEGLPLSILEAMAAKRPVVASRVGGNPEVIADGETGLLVPPASPEALAAAIHRILSDPALAQRLAMGGHSRVRDTFSAEVMSQRVMETYDDLLQSRTRR